MAHNKDICQVPSLGNRSDRRFYGEILCQHRPENILNPCRQKKRLTITHLTKIAGEKKNHIHEITFRHCIQSNLTGIVSLFLTVHQNPGGMTS